MASLLGRLRRRRVVDDLKRYTREVLEHLCKPLESFC